MTETRTTSSTGGQKGVKAERHDLLPKAGLDAIARVFGFGASKYADHNWRRGYEWGKSYAALQRHLNAFWDGETHDEESGEPHLAHAGFHVLVLLTWLEQQGEGADNAFDDRWPASMERARRESAAEEEERLLAEQAAQDEMTVVGWADPQTITFEAVDVALPTIALLTGIPESELSLMVESQQRKAEYAMPVRYIAGIANEHIDPSPMLTMPCSVEPVFERQPGFVIDSDGECTEDYGARWIDSGIVDAFEAPAREIPTRPWDMTYEEWQDQKSTEAADIVTGQQTNGVQRSFDLR